MKQGENMMRLAEQLWPIGRSLSGQGVRDTLEILAKQLPTIEMKCFKSGEKVSDWTIPKEWNVSQAYLIDPDGRKICDYSVNNLHLMGYSIPVNEKLSLENLQPHLFSLENQPDAIPYVTSYYKENWGFCLRDDERKNLQEGLYQVLIESSLDDGQLDYAELFIEGKSKREILFSTYICHPSMANNELSGPVLAAELAKSILPKNNYYSYRFLFIPETIGSIAYISKNIGALRENLLAGYVLTCVGDDRTFSYVPSRLGNTAADRVALEVITSQNLSYEHYSWKDRGSDERQFSAPGVDLPVCSVMRSKYGEYPEYHTSLDTLGEVVTIKGLQGSFDFYSNVISHLEGLRFPKITTLGEPQLGKRGLYPNTSIKGAYEDVSLMMDMISYMDGKTATDEIASLVGASQESVEKITQNLERERLITL